MRLLALLLVACGAKAAPPIANRAVSEPACARGPIAILTIEVLGPLSSEDIRFARDLTRVLRSRPKPDEVPPPDDKLFVDPKLMFDCESEAVTCMAAIGEDLEAGRLLYGKVQRTPEGYQVTLKLLDVARRAVVSSVSEPLALATPVADWARKAYDSLVTCARG